MIGVDIIEIHRISSAYEKHPKRFVDRTLTELEKKEFDIKSNRISYLAGRWAAKEAISKALQTGIGAVAFKNIQITTADSGKPIAKIIDHTFSSQYDIEVTISHSKEHAVAFCILTRL